ncbi:MAG: DUF5011 domain-containing protein [Bacteroidia bacterium]|nr:DUF5011 domain-containing protein [Bacteroidia bacterium]
MKIRTIPLIALLLCSMAWSQSNPIWQRVPASQSENVKASKQDLPKDLTYSLDLTALNKQLDLAPTRGQFTGTSNVIVPFPDSNGEFQNFRILKAPVLHPDLAEKYPEIQSYVGQGILDASTIIRFSVSPLGLSSMQLSAMEGAVFIEPYTIDQTGYVVFKKSDKMLQADDFECEVVDAVNKTLVGPGQFKNADDGILRNYRLAVSATGEYTQYHGGTKALALAAMNTTMTRVNGIFEVDFNVTMTLIANTDDVIYTNPSNDPYGNTTSNYNSQLQSTLTSVIGEANYDIGHLFANLQNNGNAGCIGCVCVNNQKGSGWTSASVPEGDFFDVDYVAHEMGHQFGANHTWTFGGNEGTNAQMEPGSGSTIMSYAGITGATDVQPQVDPYFHAVSVQQVTNYIKSTTCQTNINTGNNVPTVNAGSNYTIPRGTPFVLEGTASDVDAGDVLTYCWEQFDENNASTTYPNVNNTSGVAFRSFNPSTDAKRYFPRLQTIKQGATSWTWEAVPNVARNLNFRLTVRDNVAGGGTNNSDNMVVTVNGTAGPFVVNSPNTNVTWNAGTTQTVTWNVAGTTANGVNTASVDIYLSTDGGDTYSIALASNVPNDGSHDILVPNNQGNQNRIMVKGNNNIFFDISNANFTIAGQVVCNVAVPTGLTISNVGSDAATAGWDAVAGANYDVRYREVGTSTWTEVPGIAGVSYNITGLTPLTQYEVQVRSVCPDTSTSAYSSSVTFTTTDVQLNYCSSASTNINDEYIGRVQLNTIDNSSGGQFYTDFTNISTTLTKGSQYTITVTPTWTGTVYAEGYSVWIDYNRDGDFTDAGEQVWSQSATTATPVSGNFTIPSGAVENSTRMRVSMKYNGIPTSCETFTYGEVEDYTVIIEGTGPDTTPPVITLTGPSVVNLNVGDTYTEQGATATDNVDGDITANIVIGGDTVDTNTAATYVVTYNVSDAAGNAATEVTRTVNVNEVIDTTPPVITLIGPATINLTVGDTYTEQGATATDDIDGDISSNIVIGGDVVDTNIASTYVVTYNVSDAAGNAATEVTRTVNVSEPSSGCTGGITSYPYNEGFENTLGGWTQSTADDLDWTVDSGGTQSNNTGPDSASEGSFYIYVEASGNNTGYPNKQAIINSPCFDLSGLSTPSFKFDYHMYGSSDMGTIALEASTDEGANWTSLWSESGNKGNIWLSQSIDLSAYAGGSVQLRFNRITGGTWQADIAIDNIELSQPAPPTCNDGIQNGDETGVDCGGTFCDPCTSIDVVLNEGYFETGWDGWSDGGSDCARTSTSLSFEGNYSIRLRDNSGVASSMTLSNIDVTPYSQLEIDFYFYVNSMENGEDFWVRFYNGSTWTTVATYVSGSGINNGSFYNATVTLTPAQYNFASNSGFRFQCDASGNNDQIYVDQVTITGTTSAKGGGDQLVLVGTMDAPLVDEDIALFPVPVKGNILNVKFSDMGNFGFTIKNLVGQQVLKGQSDGQIDVSSLKSGLYIIEINDGEEITTKRFIRQ